MPQILVRIILLSKSNLLNCNNCMVYFVNSFGHLHFRKERRSRKVLILSRFHSTFCRAFLVVIRWTSCTDTGTVCLTLITVSLLIVSHQCQSYISCTEDYILKYIIPYSTRLVFKTSTIYVSTMQ